MTHRRATITAVVGLLAFASPAAAEAPTLESLVGRVAAIQTRVDGLTAQIDEASLRADCIGDVVPVQIRRVKIGGHREQMLVVAGKHARAGVRQVAVLASGCVVTALPAPR